MWFMSVHSERLDSTDVGLDSTDATRGYPLASKADRPAIDAAAAILAEEESRLGITHAGFAMTGLPHKAPPPMCGAGRGGGSAIALAKPSPAG